MHNNFGANLVVAFEPHVSRYHIFLTLGFGRYLKISSFFSAPLSSKRILRYLVWLHRLYNRAFAWCLRSMFLALPFHLIEKLRRLARRLSQQRRGPRYPQVTLRSVVLSLCLLLLLLLLVVELLVLQVHKVLLGVWQWLLLVVILLLLHMRKRRRCTVRILHLQSASATTEQRRNAGAAVECRWDSIRHRQQRRWGWCVGWERKLLPVRLAAQFATPPVGSLRNDLSSPRLIAVVSHPASCPLGFSALQLGSCFSFGIRKLSNSSSPGPHQRCWASDPFVLMFVTCT